jgi:lipopolysaccharide/colanic/teichoic acid biosynthesis glycosyltransferase
MKITVSAQGNAKRSSQDRYKRGLDLTVLVLAHLFLLPLWLFLWTVIPLAIWLEDRGPVFYRQDRVGLGGRVFPLLKFRSMCRREGSQPWSGFTAKNDPRITRVGRVLRVLALDELPQVINIWKGDISFVGPRPLPVYMHEADVQEEPAFILRLQVRPGLTGLAQVYLPRHSSPQKRLRYDLLYIRTANPWLDLKLIFLSGWLTVTCCWGRRRRESEEAPSGSLRMEGR